jgi:hypothetical protein
MNGYSTGTMNTQPSILYTYRNPWPRRLVAAGAILVLLVASAAGYRLLQQDEAVGPVAQSVDAER